ncbi:hypothetical protein BACI71_90022 [Bacillus mycoides]|uniref:Uncharacterized protein n=1 Tax=Bacillus mycoides TaxID=1405 RepID=A0A654BXZ2_BACMY|nr:hypothetical protein BACI71_90022 [Bacillus mycoides]
MKLNLYKLSLMDMGYHPTSNKKYKLSYIDMKKRWFCYFK